MTNFKIYVIGVTLGSLFYTWFVFTNRKEEIFASLRQDVIVFNTSVIAPHLRQSTVRDQKFIDENTLLVENTVSLNQVRNEINEQKTTFTEPTVESKANRVDSLPGLSPSMPMDSGAFKCMSMKEKYFVEPGSSWGSLTVELQKLWSSMKCDEAVQGIVVDKKIEMVDPVEPPVEEDAVKRKKKRRKGKKDLGEAAGLPDISKSHSEWCYETRQKYHVKPMKSWGSLPMNEIDTWKKRRCDLVFTGDRMKLRLLSKCLPVAGSKSVGENPNLSDSLPLIAIMAATTTRKVVNPSTDNMALFTYLLPSVIRTLDCGYRYEYVLGYDKGDPFYDSSEGIDKVKRWFKSHVEEPMLANGIRVALRLVKVNNTLKKPGPVFLEMARAAYKAGASYFYRINDDTELTVNWADAFVRTLLSLPAPYGALGPTCSQGNDKILTHDFTARLHMEIFEMNYYPPELTDWWMDDWISLVYGQSRTFKAASIPVIHHTGAHGQRYAVDSSHANLLDDLVKTGRMKIRQWMLKNGVPQSELELFDKDVFRQGFTHKDIPASIMAAVKAL